MCVVTLSRVLATCLGSCRYVLCVLLLCTGDLFCDLIFFQNKILESHAVLKWENTLTYCYTYLTSVFILLPYMYTFKALKI